MCGVLNPVLHRVLLLVPFQRLVKLSALSAALKTDSYDVLELLGTRGCEYLAGCAK
jgi:hypothetical protein